MQNSARPQADSDAASILNLVKQVQYKAYVQLEATFQPLGVTAVQFRILTTISSRPSLSSAELARIYDVKPQTMIRQIALLESKGLIERQASKANKRLLELSLTKAGQACLDRCRDRAQALESKLLEPLEADEQNRLRASLQKLQQSMSSLPRQGKDIEELTQEYRRVGIQRV